MGFPATAGLHSCAAMAATGFLLFRRDGRDDRRREYGGSRRDQDRDRDRERDRDRRREDDERTRSSSGYERRRDDR